MRGRSKKQQSMVTLMTPEQVVPKDHPLRSVKELADDALRELSPVLDEMYARRGRHSIPPEQLLKAMLLMALYSVRSERMFCEQLGYNLLFKWFLDMDMTDEAFNHSSFGKNRDRLLRHDVAGKFLQAVVAQARRAGLMSSEHFSVDGTLIEAWASMKSFRPKDEDDDDRPDSNGWADFRGQKRSNETHESKTDPEAKLARKGNGREAKLSYSLNALMENKNGLVVAIEVEQATGWAERETALAMLDQALPGDRRITLGGDKGYDTKDFVAECRQRNVTPHVAQNTSGNRRSAIDGRTTEREGYRVSSIVRRRIEGILGWTKTTGNFRKTRYCGREKTDLWAKMTGAAYDLLRMARLLAAPT
jgi:transposase